jgi:elongation factor 2
MRRFRQVDEILKVMSSKESIRNIGIVAHIDHGKTTMTDSLLVEAGLLPPQVAGTAKALDYLEEEQRRGITMKTANISLLHKLDGHSYVINLIDTPGHVDFTGKVTRALRAIDGVVVVVDAVEEIMAQTETVTCQALEERVKPVLFINKVDRLIKELKLNADEIQEKFTRIIRNFNNLIEIYAEPKFRKKWKADPAKEAVAFGSALHNWGFTLDMARQREMSFADIIDAYAKDKPQTLSKLLPLSEAILRMTIKNSPCPVEAQKYRIPRIWKGDISSRLGQAMLNCDDNGPTAMCITNAQVDPSADVVATGRLFSGSVRDGDIVYLVGARKECKVRQVTMYMSAFREAVNQITAGNIAALTGLDQARAGETLIDITHKDQMVPFEPVRYVSESVITIAVEPRYPKDLARLSEAMERLSIEDPNLVVAINNRTGEYLLSGVGELHLETAVKFLRDYSGGVDISTSDPMADYRESLATKGLKVMAKSPNKRNELWIQVEPLEDTSPESKTENRPEEIWASDEYGNTLVNSTRNVKHLDEVKGMIISGFHWACRTGPLCEQPLKNVKAKLLDAQIHEDSALRESTQIMRATSRAILGSFLTTKPILLEPIYKIEAHTPAQWFGMCTNVITRRRGKIQAAESRGVLAKIVGYIPVSETFGLAAEIRASTSGHAFWQTVFDHWAKVPDGIAAGIIEQIRVRKGLSREIPKPEKFIDDKA